jgi:WD40 repeat protein
VLTVSVVSTLNAQESWKELQQIDSYLGLPGRPDDDLKDLEEARIEGSCEWLAERENFQKWADSESGTSPKIYWICAKPATGKSVLSGYIINTLSGLNLDCSYYFFRHSDKEKSTVSGLLRSMVYQMASISVNVRQKLLTMIERGVRFDKDDGKAVWRKLVVPVISRLESFQTQHWILDALDECSGFDIFFPMMASIESTTPIKILITSRNMPGIVQQFSDLQRHSSGQAAICEGVSFDDSRADIALYLEGNRTKLHVGSGAQRDRFLNRILEKSEGCFLWVRLVLDELALAWTVTQVERVLEEVPQSMDPLYTRAVSMMSSKPKYAKDLARAILTWIVCAVRPLTIPELQRALKMDLGDDVHDLESAIASLCAQLVHVDKTGRVLVVHLTARTFLVDPRLESEFSINETLGHLRLAEICLQYLCSDKMKSPRARRSKKVHTRQMQRSPFVFYACPAFAEHLRQTTSKNGVLSVLLYNFLQGNVLSWIEHIASTGNLSVLTRTANSVKAYLQRHIQISSPLGEFVQLVESWVVDLHRVVAKFGINLISSPSAIFWLIPPFCPASSAIASSSGSSSRGIIVKGLTDTGWEDCLSCIDSHDKQASSVACGEAFFAVGYSFGNIALHHNTTCQQWKMLEHGGPVQHLRFDSTGTMLVSSGRRDLRVWDIERGFMLWSFATIHDILAFTFLDKDRVLMVATRGNFAYSWSLQSGRDVRKTDWTESIPFNDEGQFRRPPLTAAFSPDESLIAIVYRGRSIYLYDVEGSELHGLVGRERDPAALALGTNTSPASLVFNANEAIPLLAAAYEDGDLCLFDYEELKLLKVLEANAQIVACSPDGLTLATGNSAGMVQLMEFETLQLLYRVNAVDYGIRCIAFSADNLCFLDVRGTQCNVWEPPVLSGLARRDERSTDATFYEPVIKGMSDGEIQITRIMLEDKGDFFFITKSDGTVCVYDTENGIQRRILYRHAYQIPVTSMDWGSRRNIIVTADTASRFIVCALKRDNSTGWALSAKLMDGRTNSPILDVLLNPTNDLLLISAADLNTVWNIANKTQTSSKESKRNTPFTWMNHPLNKQHRILVAPNAATIIDWESSSTMVSNDLLLLPEGVLLNPCQSVKNAISFADDHLVVVELSELYGERSTTQMLVFESENFGPGAAGLIPLPSYQIFGKEVMHLVGACGSKLVFLNKSRWVCPINVKQTDYNTYIRHFPIPSDWQSQQRVLRMGVTCKGDIFFARTEEVAVIKRGLEFEESVALDRAWT